MENESQTPNVSSQVSAQTLALPSSANVTVVNPLEGVLKRIANEAAKYTVFAIFSLYSIGFIIWHSYLASYGLTSVAFLQAEYLSAAFCYLFILATFAIPPFLIAKAIGQNIKAKGLRHAFAADKAWIVIVSIWSYLSGKIIGIFLPGTAYRSPVELRLMAIASVIAAVHLLLAIISGIKSGAFNGFWRGKTTETDAQVRWRNTRFHRIVARGEYIGIYMLAFTLISVLSNPNINNGFIVSTMLLYSTAIGSTAGNDLQTWNKSGPLIRTLLVVVNILFLISNIQSFATNQFSKIPKSVGGGKPETAYLKFGSNHLDVPTSLNIPFATNIGVSSGFVGPIGILLRSDKEILFVNYSEANAADTLTNSVVLNVQTNIGSTIITNAPKGAPATNAVGDINFALLTIIQTNRVTVHENISTNTIKLTARQVRADLVDAIILSK